MANKEEYTALITAIDSGQTENALALINGGADMNFTNTKDDTALMEAIGSGRTEIALALINGGADINVANKKGDTALIKATHWRRTEIVLALINGGADVNVTNKEGDTALIEASRQWGRTEIALALINGGAYLNVANKEGDTSLIEASRWGRTEIALALINGGAYLNVANKEGDTALIKATYLRQTEIVIALINGGADLNVAKKDGATALIKASHWGLTKIALALINGGADMNVTNKEGDTALIKASCCGQTEIALALIKGGADMNVVNKEGDTALIKATYWGRAKIIIALINGGADMNANDNEDGTALIKAIGNRQTEIAIALINGGADMNFTNKEGGTALMEAINSGQTEIALALINRGADINVTNKEGKTALIEAVLLRKTKIALALINGGADTNVANKEGDTALIEASRCGETEIVRALINGGADMNVTNKDGNTALIEAFLGGQTSIVRALITAGADVKSLVYARDSDGRTALFYEILKTTNSSAQYLLDNGANLYQKDHFNVSILSYFIHHCISEKLPQQTVKDRLYFFKENGLKDEDPFKAMINAIFCKLPLHDFNYTVVSKMLRLTFDYVGKHDGYNQEALESLIMLLEEKMIQMSDLSNVFATLIDLGADPNSADEKGNTAMHYLSLHVLEDIPSKIILEICDTLECCGALSNKKNCNQETPLLFLLLKAVKHLQNDGCFSGISPMIDMCRFLLKDGTIANDLSQSGETVFHVIIELLQGGLLLNDLSNRTFFLPEAIKLLKLFSPPKVKKGVTVNMVDEHLNTPLHRLASLVLPPNIKYSAKVTVRYSFEQLFKIVLEHLLKCGAMLNARNRKEETPLHVCKTWSALKLLLEQRANRNDHDSRRRPPLLVAAQNKVFLVNPGHFFPDVKDDPKSFFTTCVKLDLDLWACDDLGESILSILLESEVFVLANALIDAVCESKPSLLEQLLVTICKDKSTHSFWKSPLVGKILRSRGSPKIDLNLALQHCCINIKRLHDEGESFEFDEGGETEKTIKWRTQADKTPSVHLEIARQLRLHGANGESCIYLCKNLPQLHKCLTEEIDLDQVPVSIPWTSYSKNHEAILARVARRQNIETIGTYLFHQDPIGNGSFGHVFAGINEKDGREVAIKKIEKLRLVRPEDRREITNLTALADCQQVVSYIYFDDSDKNFVYTVLELMEGHLDDYLTSFSFDASKSTILCKNVVMGLKYLHDHKPVAILHRDLKPGNILYKLHPEVHLKIADFGLSSPLTTGTTVRGTNVGTRCWIAPEVISSSKYSMSSDVFSCGLLLHYILSLRKHPFNPADCTKKTKELIDHETQHNMLYAKMEGWNDALSPEATHLIKGMLLHNGDQRPPAADSLSHPLFWKDKTKMDLLTAVGNQPEFECPRPASGRLNAVESDLEAEVLKIVRHGTWNDAGYAHMPDIYIEMRKPLVKTDKKGKTYTVKSRVKYDTGSVVELVRFIRNAIAHVSEARQPCPVRKQILEDAVFLKEFPHLVMEIVKAVTKHGWDAREEIKHVLANE